ncbi:ATP-binding cassette domain-containing protein [Lactobacillus sp. Sy-1]|uniref:ABC transporter ATP-binding protein/permease n=1 Tax=Lactobacillus sp. Sy-1 TaxID=2109645 RepID=UPI001C59D126|nr:ABC transporter ATP-binding protein/permease [Lactobacillus sp. Sy-1]MBW1604847.1 ATP-binding cassette domain-containing protein [Lactobacillus sp. Sy-1]
MALLELKDIRKSYYLGKEEFKVLKGISLEFNHGEFVSLLGESGGGKSTLMNIIGGLDSNYQGDVLLNGSSLKHDTDKQLDEYRRKTIGFIFQNFNLIGHMTILDNVRVALEMSDLSRSEQNKRSEDLLKRVGLGEHIHKHPNQLSGGQKQRVAIARALASDPDIIIADEPTGALDAQNTDEILKLLDEIASEGKLVLTVTHSDKVAAYGTRVVHMASGQIDSDKKLRDAYKTEPSSGMKLHPLSIVDTFKMAFQQMTYNLKRNLLIIFGGAIGIFSVIFMLGLGNGIKGYINHQIYDQINPNSVQVTKGKGDSSTDASAILKSNVTNSDINKIRDVKNVKSVEKGSMALSPQLTYNGKATQGQILQTYNSTMLEKSIKQGDKPSKLNTILLPKSVAQKIKSDYKSLVGKQIDLSFATTGKNGQPTQMSRKVTVSGISDSASPVIAVSYNTLKSIYSSNNQTLKTNFVTANIKGGVAEVNPTQDSIKALKDSNGKKDFQITGAGSIVSTLNTYISLAVNVLAAIAGISLLVSAIMIIVVLYISVAERTKEIGILRALGVTKGNVRGLFFSESLLLGLFSSVSATIVAYLIEWGINSAASGAINYSIIQITPGNAIFGIVVAIVINLLAALLPSGRAAKLDPIESLSAE